jgi:hypothetical protein
MQMQPTHKHQVDNSDEHFARQFPSLSFSANAQD